MSRSAPPGPNPIVALGWKMAAGFALVLGGFLVGGLLLPGTWAASASREIDAPPEQIFAFLDDPRGWDAWTPWPDVEFTYSGPRSGEGARRSWDHPELGSGSFTVLASDPPRSVRYRVDVDDGALVTVGELRLDPVAGTRTRVTWTEDGDFGGNPLVAYAALGMGERQSAELRASLQRLASAVDSTATARTDSAAALGFDAPPTRDPVASDRR